MIHKELATSALDALQARIGHFFRDRSLLEQAVTHPSGAIEAGQSRLLSYERLEFLGDSFLNAWVAELIFDRFRQENEGVLARLRSYWVSGPVLARFALQLRLDSHIVLGSGEGRDGGKNKERILAAVFESLVAALYLDAGARFTRKFVMDIWRDPVRRRGLGALDEDAKTKLQELRQGAGKPLPEYVVEEAFEGGFKATVILDKKVAGSGAGVNKKSAEQAAARDALLALGVAERI